MTVRKNLVLHPYIPGGIMRAQSISTKSRSMLGTANVEHGPDLRTAPALPADYPAEMHVPRTLLAMMQELSHARTLESIIDLVRAQARTLMNADGVSFVLRDGDQCHYVDENAIGPLWKGRRFPMQTCVSGWVMNNKQATAIEDIYNDPRVPIDAYAITFVKSLAMAPIRRQNPIGAIGVYWGKHHATTQDELTILQALADSVSIAMENVALYAELQSKMKELQESNYELSRFAWVASHDLQEPLRTITTQVELLQRRHASKLDDQARKYISTATGSARRLQHLVEDLLVHARIEQSEHFKPIVMGDLVRTILMDMNMTLLQSEAHITMDDLPWIWGEEVMLRRLMQNLISNAVKFAKPGESPRVHIGCTREQGFWHFMVRDEGIGIEPEQHERIFGLFQRIHAQAIYPGSGIGLATCKKIVELHHGSIWVESDYGEGSTFHVMLPLAGEEMPKEGVPHGTS